MQQHARTIKIIQLLAAGAIIAASFYFSRLIQANAFAHDIIASFGHISILMTGFVAGLNLLVPVPAISFLPVFLAAGFPQWEIILLIAVGATLADGAAYVIGRAGRAVIETKTEKKIAQWVGRVQEEYAWAVYPLVFLFAAFAPLPNEVIIIPLAFLGYRFLPICALALAGNLVFNTLAALGVMGILNVL